MTTFPTSPAGLFEARPTEVLQLGDGDEFIAEHHESGVHFSFTVEA